ncbi:hypothetical protein TrVFT333_007218 [Trichoderma virens FT-333]|nr:hypothetical protein TrVFT333_007218 [Trichoderma virens FT-333]
MTAVAGVGIIGATFYATRKNESKVDDAQSRRNRAQETRELGLGSADVGGNRMTGGPSNSAAPSGTERDHQRDQANTASAKEALPTGGVGGGEGSSKSDHFRLHTTILGSGGKTTASRQDHEGYHDTRGISKMGAEIPSKKGPADASD